MRPPGANAGLKVTSLVTGMVAGADSIDDMALLRHGGLARVFARVYAPSTLGSFLRAFSFGHIRQLDAVASRFLLALAKLSGLMGPPAGATGAGDQPERYGLIDVDDTVVEVHGHAKQGAGFGYNRIRGLNALLATLTLTGTSPVIVAQRLRRGSTASARARVLVRMDSAFYGRGAVRRALGTAVAVGSAVHHRGAPMLTKGLTNGCNSHHKSDRTARNSGSARGDIRFKSPLGHRPDLANPHQKACGFGDSTAQRRSGGP